MAKEYTVKSFKSGNSVAFRLPKALGIEAGEDMVIVAHSPDSISIWKKRDAKNVFMRLYGSMSPGFMDEGRQDAEQAEYDWPRPDDHSAAA
ncbi:AbrB/MazE/SpoVT family DNA-binding domain-containing protein [Novosphingobium acidiphilum]|uniref:AbrB/MazE/SpoVT family DNA-binding domain-containing protein n=1 Tax=Novosphingobium acidiphilum TaxID=505248 RepID=UPI00040B96BB|nr:AbrB/MazE/SpoVT family DNA-binding domain-containing protein [Novosphingobium acidiphilum]